MDFFLATGTFYMNCKMYLAAPKGETMSKGCLMQTFLGVCGSRASYLTVGIEPYATALVEINIKPGKYSGQAVSICCLFVVLFTSRLFGAVTTRVVLSRFSHFVDSGLTY